jgi:DNA-binding IscR family transcriptional regulator
MSLKTEVRWIRSHQINDPHAESIFLAIAFRATDKGSCGCTIKELARQVSLSVREVHEKLRLLRSLRMVSTFAGKGGYAFFLPHDPFHEWRPSVVH